MYVYVLGRKMSSHLQLDFMGLQSVEREKITGGVLCWLLFALWLLR